MEGGCWCNFCPFDVFNGIRRVSSRRHSICRVRLMAAARGSRTRPGRMPRAAGVPDIAARTSQLDATRYDSARLGSTWSTSIYLNKRYAARRIRDKLSRWHLDSSNSNVRKRIIRFRHDIIWSTSVNIINHCKGKSNDSCFRGSIIESANKLNINQDILIWKLN